jgi:hypothetical protein
MSTPGSNSCATIVSCGTYPGGIEAVHRLRGSTPNFGEGPRISVIDDATRRTDLRFAHAVAGDELAQRRAALAVEVLLTGGGRFRAGVLQAVGDDAVSFLQLIRILGELAPVLLQQVPQAAPVAHVHRAFHGADQVVLAIDAGVPRRERVRRPQLLGARVHDEDARSRGRINHRGRGRGRRRRWRRRTGGCGRRCGRLGRLARRGRNHRRFVAASPQPHGDQDQRRDRPRQREEKSAPRGAARKIWGTTQETTS